MLYANVGGIRDPVKQETALELCKSQNKDICILAETHIGNEQIHQIKNNWLGPILISAETLFQKAYLSCFIQAFLMLLKLTQIHMGDSYPSNLLLLMIEFFVSMHHQGIVTENN